MKTKFFLFFLLSAFLFGCSEKPGCQYDGSWKLVKASWVLSDSMKYEYPGNVASLDGSWIISGENSIYLMKYQLQGDTTFIFEYSKLTQKFEGNKIIEKYILPDRDDLVGKTETYNIEIKGDSLYFSGPVDDSRKGGTPDLYQIYVRE
jgi:hypothetical protein